MTGPDEKRQAAEDLILKAVTLIWAAEIMLCDVGNTGYAFDLANARRCLAGLPVRALA